MQGHVRQLLKPSYRFPNHDVQRAKQGIACGCCANNSAFCLARSCAHVMHALEMRFHVEEGPGRFQAASLEEG